ncbi:flavin reductase family protein [Faecalicatena orotica]|uniref:flavin reductase family protein n=1 Tax=Faecalicatena orotica TaxID=1544 RepID=UPI00321716CE
MKKENYMNAITQGVYILGVKDNTKINFMTAAWLTQISSRPNKILVAVAKSHLTADLIHNAGKFAVNILADGQEVLAKKCGSFSGREFDKSIGVDYEMINGTPAINGTAGYLHCELTSEIEDTDHVLFLAEVKDGEKYQKLSLRYDESYYF